MSTKNILQIYVKKNPQDFLYKSANNILILF